DLTLFEVDEAATRIREEVDPDANIILGATFDDSLDGIVRVSVVATGIDTEVEIDGETVAARTSELADRLNAISASRAKLAEATAPTAPAADAAEAEIEAELKIPEPAIEHVAEDPEVTIERYVPDAAAFAGPEPEIEDEPVAPVAEDTEPAPKVFIPPEVVTAEKAAPRMPRVDEFPVVAQRELRRKTEEEMRDELPDHGDHEEIDDRGPIGILRRLAHVGLGRREEPAEDRSQRREPAKPTRPAHREAAPEAARRPEASVRGSAPKAPESEHHADKPRLPKRPPAPSQAGSEALYQPRKGDLDQHGRAVPKRPALDDDQLEIPAFLRRQVN
ncbi:MAG: cell division protein FtsZ, partial [Hyphomicrobiales bacterium]|nr:cell division protein FtsZ [Hyphomicrobiales bacterium]